MRAEWYENCSFYIESLLENIKLSFRTILAEKTLKTKLFRFLSEKTLHQILAELGWKLTWRFFLSEMKRILFYISHRCGEIFSWTETKNKKSWKHRRLTLSNVPPGKTRKGRNISRKSTKFYSKVLRYMDETNHTLVIIGSKIKVTFQKLSDTFHQICDKETSIKGISATSVVIGLLESPCWIFRISHACQYSVRPSR